MAHVSFSTGTPVPIERRWPRRRTRAWLRPNGGGSNEMMFALIPSLPRAILSRLTQQMIDRMDQMDGDSDIELNGDEFDFTGSHEEDNPFCHDSHPGDPDDSEDSYDQEQEETYG